MAKKTTSIPVNTMYGAGIAIGKATVAGINIYKEVERSHRDSYHSFFMMESGTAAVEIDFQRYDIAPFSIAYIHPNQVHRIVAFENATVCFCLINKENLNPEYLRLLEDIAPAKPLYIGPEAFSLIDSAATLAIKLFERNEEKLYHSSLKGSCNTLLGLIVAQYLEQAKPMEILSRFEIVTKAFRSLLENNFTIIRKPSEYAEKLNISIPYLNECVKNTTGNPVSHHIQQRIILEAKRLLYYSDKSVKEIASELGYDDYPYFSRLFTKNTGMSAMAFRNKNLD